MAYTAYVFLAEGFEEVEALASVDVLRRAGVSAHTVSISSARMVSGAHGVPVQSDLLFADADFARADLLVLPGGMPGTTHLWDFTPLHEVILAHHRQGRLLAAICAAPMIYGRLGLLDGRRATCYPGFEDELRGALLTDDDAVFDAQFVTGRSAGNAVLFGLKMVEALFDAPTAARLAAQIVMPH